MDRSSLLADEVTQNTADELTEEVTGEAAHWTGTPSRALPRLATAALAVGALSAPVLITLVGFGAGAAAALVALTLSGLLRHTARLVQQSRYLRTLGRSAAPIVAQAPAAVAVGLRDRVEGNVAA